MTNRVDTLQWSSLCTILCSDMYLQQCNSLLCMSVRTNTKHLVSSLNCKFCCCCRMLESTTFTLRVVISDSEIRKLRLSSKPNTVDQLQNKLKTSLNIGYPFVVLYEDREFNNELCSLEQIDDLQPFSTIRIVEMSSEVESSSSSASASTSSVPIGMAASETGLRQGTGNWPEDFHIPQFDHDVELILSRGNAEFRDSGKLLILSRSAKGAILQRIVTAVYDIKAYPTESEFTSVAQALITKHPCLRESGTRAGYDGWRNSLQFKMGNYRNDIRRAGGAELVINGGRRSRYNPDLPNGRSRIKKPRRGESNYLPNLPVAEEDSRNEQEILKRECLKTHPDTRMVHDLMAKTFALRRQVIIKEMPPVACIKESWPALFIPVQVRFMWHLFTSLCCMAVDLSTSL